MADWFTSKRKAPVATESSDLSSPLLLPHGTEDSIDERTSSQKQRDITTAFAAHAVANAPIPATSTHHSHHHYHNRQCSSSNLSSRHSRHRLNKMKRHASNLSKQLSTVSDTASSSDITHQMMHNLTSSIISTAYSRTESEITDYNIGQSTDGKNDRRGPSSADIIEKSQPSEPLSSETKAKVAIVILVTSCGIGAYIAAFISSIIIAGGTAATADTIVIGIAGATSIFISTPLVWISEWRLVHLPLLRSSINRMRELAMRFQRELDILVMEEESLRGEVEDIKESNKHLEKIVTDNGGNVDELVSLVQENQEILRQMKENIRQVVLQDVVKLVLQSDIDRDGTISKREADILAHRLAISLDVYGIVFDTEKFHRAVGLSPSICGVLTIVQRLLPNEEGEYSDRRSSFYSLDSEDYEDYANEEEQEDDDVYDMFYVPVEGEFNKGCAESISMCRQYSEVYGERPSLISLAPTTKRKSMNALRVSVSVNSLK